MAKNLIRDGYTIKARIAGVKNHYSDLCFTFRPVLAEEVERIDAALEKVGGPQQIAILAKMLAERIVEWSEVDEKGQPEPIKFDTVRLLPRPLLLRAAGIVRMLQPGDDVPQSEEETAELMRLIEGSGSLEEALRGN